MNKKERIIETCTGYTHEGLGVVRHNNIPVFVKYLIRNEKAEIEIIKVLKNYCIGRIVRIIEESHHRVIPECSVYKQCGGCSIMHMDRYEQSYFKTLQVKENLRKIGHVDTQVNDCLMDNKRHYRNKVQVPFGIKDNKIISGFYTSRTNTIIDNDECLIQNHYSNKVTKTCKELFERYHVKPYDKVNHTGTIKHVLTRYGYHTHAGMIVLISYKKYIPHINDIVDTLVNMYPETKSIILNINERHDNVILGEKEIVLYGKPYIYDYLLGNEYKISLKSFYQINPRQVEVLYNKAIEYANLNKNDVVLDAYCGIGTIGLSICDHVKEVYGVEIVPEAIKDAKENAIRNHKDNIHFYCEDASDYMKENKDKFKVVIVDPPRKGCSKEFLEAFVESGIHKLVYISCNVSTQARDIDYLKEYGYEVQKVQPVDMFPMTRHVETIVLLSRKAD